ncbi:ribonuclease domain-containing protein [Saccharomonospora sp. NPDC006951]
MLSRRRISAALIGLIVLVLGGWLIKDVISAGDSGDAPGSVPGAESGLRVEPLSSLPEQADATYRLIEKDGPFPYPERDGTVFGNRERLLPEKESGYYREYTVPTPGSADRGARRLVEGQADELYYTADHYSSFVVVDPSR